MQPTLSVILITKNAASDLERCLESVKWADEIIVLDSGSSDGSLEIIKKYTDKFECTNWPGFGPQKNCALSKATCDWILSIDADEWLSPELLKEIQATLESPRCDAYALPRFSYFLNRLMRYGSWRNDWVVRLFRRGTGEFSNDRVHERFLPHGTVERLQSPLFHHPFKTLDQVITKMNQYSSASAIELQSRGKKATISKALLHGFWMFFRCFILKRGFLDGREGLLLAISNAEGSYYRYAKLAALTTLESEKTMSNNEGT